MTTEEQARMTQLNKENDILRGLVAKLVKPCHYCGAQDMSKCPHGFPGCSLADDLFVAEDTAMEHLLAENRKLKAAVKKAQGT